MKANMGNLDRGFRVLIALVVITLYFLQIITGTLGLVLIGLSVVFLLTSFISFCPLYAIVGISTCNLKK
jgi:hypothetical protein